MEKQKSSSGKAAYLIIAVVVLAAALWGIYSWNSAKLPDPNLQVNKEDETADTAGSSSSAQATQTRIEIPTTVGETFVDSTGFEWRVLAVENGKALIIAEHVQCVNTRYNSVDGFLPFQNAEISESLNTWYANDAFVSPELKAVAVPYAFQLNDGTVGGNGVENQAEVWESTPATTNQQQARTIPAEPGEGNKAFVLSISEMNEYFENTITARVAMRVSETGVIGEAAYWWLRSPSTHSEYTQWLVGPDGYFYYDPATHFTRHLGLRPAMWVEV